ncbi:YafY family protein [Pseudonocardia sp. MH-G8]|uniref:helix-turn-helix transcriptional regulator n=1 Tax=Pseudonocardia sp. MH-G8 TaxID=1854588 RepID=UPI000BA0E947|nr:transcriptional regulator [Pseudonocardia sp. MH-G8]OZM77440.1 transcriptional regulator [Pseudonocardia sp. MH-G8]
MPLSAAPTTSQRLLSLLSLLQVRRDWPGDLLAQRLRVSPRTVRRDVDRLRELGYPVRATKGPEGGYRLDAGSQMPPLLFDDDQAVALAIALRGAPQLGAGIGEAAARALATLRQVMPSRLRSRLDAVEPTVVDRGPPAGADPDVLLAVGAAVRAHEELRFDYAAPTAPAEQDGPPRRVQPHHLVARAGRWYLIAWVPDREAWRTYRVDRMTPRVPNGPRFTPRDVPGGDPVAFLSARFKGSDGPDQWPCRAEVVLDLPAAEVLPFAGDGVVEPLDAARCRLQIGSWSWPGLAASLLRFDADIEVVTPPELRAAFGDLAVRAEKAARVRGD